jgi:hypothetical protein
LKVVVAAAFSALVGLRAHGTAEAILQHCDASTCPHGCCSTVGPTAGECIPYKEQSNAACGTGGQVCSACPTTVGVGATCSAGACYCGFPWAPCHDGGQCVHADRGDCCDIGGVCRDPKATRPNIGGYCGVLCSSLLP